MSIARETLQSIPAPADLPAHPVATWNNEDGTVTADCACGHRYTGRSKFSGQGAITMGKSMAKNHWRSVRTAAALDALFAAADGYGDEWVLGEVQTRIAQRAEAAEAARLAEIEAKRQRYLDGYSTAALQAKVDAWDRTQPDGFARAAEALLTVTEVPEGADLRQVRADIDDEAHIQSNVAGGVYSRNVESQVHWAQRTLASGHLPTFPYAEANRAMLLREKAARDARTGVRTIEPMSVTFAGLEVHPSAR